MENVRTPGWNGYAAVVFIASRAEGDGAVHRQHLEDWSSIHDLTSRHVAVLTPDPASTAFVDRGVAVRGYALFGSRRAYLVHARSWRPEAYAPRLPLPLDEHSTAVTTVATQLQEYFGLAEEALPCAVIVCTQEREVIVAGLSARVSLYRLLKEVKSQLEPALARLNQATAELAVHKRVMAPLAAERARTEAALSAARRRAHIWSAAVGAHREWVERRTRLAAQLNELAAEADADTATRCRWLAARLADDRALNGEETSLAGPLFTALSSRIGELSSRERRSLLRRTRRVVAALGTDVAVAPAKLDDDIGHLEDEAARSRAAYDAKSPEENALAARVAAADRLDMFGAARFAVSSLGLERSPSALLPWKESSWPVTAFMSPPLRVPPVRKARG